MKSLLRTLLEVVARTLEAWSRAIRSVLGRTGREEDEATPWIHGRASPGPTPTARPAGDARRRPVGPDAAPTDAAPKHWRDSVESGPPEHWLEHIRRKAPGLAEALEPPRGSRRPSGSPETPEGGPGEAPDPKAGGSGARGGRFPGRGPERGASPRAEFGPGPGPADGAPAGEAPTGDAPSGTRTRTPRVPRRYDAPRSGPRGERDEREGPATGSGEDGARGGTTAAPGPGPSGGRDRREGPGVRRRVEHGGRRDASGRHDPAAGRRPAAAPDPEEGRGHAIPGSPASGRASRTRGDADAPRSEEDDEGRRGPAGTRGPVETRVGDDAWPSLPSEGPEGPRPSPARRLLEDWRHSRELRREQRGRWNA